MGDRRWERREENNGDIYRPTPQYRSPISPLNSGKVLLKYRSGYPPALTTPGEN